MTVHSAPPPHSLASRSLEDGVITEIARRMSVPEDRIRARDRTPHVVAARHTVFRTLSLLGRNPATIARAMALNHSTIVHGLANAESHPDWCAVAAATATNFQTGGPYATLRAHLAATLRDVQAHDRWAIEHYLTCTLLAWKHHPSPSCAYGLWLLATNPDYYAAAAAALRACSLDLAILRIDLQARHLGYPPPSLQAPPTSDSPLARSA